MEQKDILFKEIDLIQGCIERMSKNSFEIKKWAVGLITIMMGLFKSLYIVDKVSAVIILTMLIISFWYLDAYYLQLERRFRCKYNWIIKNHSLEKDLGELVKQENLFDLNPSNSVMVLKEDKKRFQQNIMISKSLFGYLLLLILCILLLLGPEILNFLKC